MYTGLVPAAGPHLRAGGSRLRTHAQEVVTVWALRAEDTCAGKGNGLGSPLFKAEDTCPGEGSG